MQTSQRRAAGVSESAVPGITELFAIRPGEEIKGIKDVGGPVIFIVTNKRIVKLDLQAVLMGQS
jgi:hypothetical protein